MHDKPFTLPQIQRWMQSVLMHPGGVEAALAADETRQHLDVSAHELETVIGRSRALDSVARLEIYVDAYYERLLECLGEEFPATRAAVGDDLFGGLAFGYLQHHPSRSYTLNLLGASFPGFLAETRLHEQGASEGRGASWSTFVIELARFERTLRDVFDAPGSEDCPVLRLEDLRATGSEQLGDARLTIAPPLRLEAFEHPVQQFWGVMKEGTVPALPEPHTTWLAIHRRQYVVERFVLEREQFLLLEHLVAGHSVSGAIELTNRTPGVRRDRLEQHIGAWFAEWTTSGFFLGLELNAPRLATDTTLPRG